MPGPRITERAAGMLLAASLVAALPGQAADAWGAEAGIAKYVGSAVCAGCHEAKYSLWKETLHANVIKDAKANPENILGDFGAEELGFKKEQILYTVGSHWDQRYMTMIDGELYVLPKLWSVQSKQWRPYNVFSWNKRPWSKFCAGCHVTGLDTANGGQYKEMRIGCEACHGPGAGHSASQKPEDIVNPAKLDRRRRDHVCASCHVRGKDLSGLYYFPVGYRPGLDLAEFLVPIDIEDEEPVGAAIDRLYIQWAQDREEKGRGKCEVCGIYGSSDKLKDKMKMTNDIMAYCFKCHEFGDKLSNHTHHSEATKLVCLDCHRAKPFSLEKEKVDVHSVRYYRIHQESCYDEDVELACIACHQHQDRDRLWAVDRILLDWRKLPELDH